MRAGPERTFSTMVTERRAESGRILQLDILRGVAILLVLFRHVVIMPDKAGHLRPVAEALFTIGWSGVDLFFVLSGYLIGGLLINEVARTGGLRVGRFIVRRAFKIVPLYAIYIGLVILLMWLQSDGHGLRKIIASFYPNFLHIQNYIGSPRPHTWSLSVEEHFYLVLPLLLLTLLRFGRLRWLPAIALAIMILGNAGRFLVRYHSPFPTLWGQTQFRLDGLMFGVLLAYLARYRPAMIERLQRHRTALTLAGLGLVAPMLFLPMETTPFVWWPGITMLYVGYGSLLLAITGTNVGEGMAGRLLAGLPARLLALLGIVSYGVYLIHWDAVLVPMTNAVNAGLLDGLPRTARWVVLMGIYVPLAGLAGWLFTRMIERPALALRERWFPVTVTPGPMIVESIQVEEEMVPFQPDSQTAA
jgi:peptidoglycan/LPS O-acetylase OafA/YrhL